MPGTVAEALAGIVQSHLESGSPTTDEWGDPIEAPFAGLTFEAAVTAVRSDNIPDGACPAHWEFHQCKVCCDGQFLRVPQTKESLVRNGTKLVPCPNCTGKAEADGVIEERSRIPPVYAGAALDGLKPGQRKAVELMASAPMLSKPFLILMGKAGSGKTHTAVVAIKEVRRRHGKRAAFWPVVELLDRYRASFNRETARERPEDIDAELRSQHLLVLDDWGKQTDTSYAHQALFRLVNERWSQLRPLIVTTNEEESSFDDALHSRLFGSKLSTVIELTGKDGRFA